MSARHPLTTAEYASFEDMVDVTRRRSCLPPERAGEVAQALDGVRESSRTSARPGRELLTVWRRPDA